MIELYNWGIDFILLLQSIGDWIIPPMIFFTSLGVEEFYLLVVPILYWCVNPIIGVRTGVMLLLSGSINTLVKWMFHQPRPYWVSTKITAYLSETSFGLPSGHAQNAVAIWGIIANSFKRHIGWVIAIILMIFIGISRPILGVHFPQDTLLGWAIGLLLLLLFIKGEPIITRWFNQKGLKFKIRIYFLLSLLLILFSAVILSLSGDWTMPETWEHNIQVAFPQRELPQPLAFSSQVSLAGVFFGLTLGHTILFHGSGFKAAGKWWQLMLRYLLGLLGVLLIWFGLDQIFPDGETLIPYVFRYLRYFFVGIWITYLAPLIFLRFRLADPQEKQIP